MQWLIQNTHILRFKRALGHELRLQTSEYAFRTWANERVVNVQLKSIENIS